MSLPKTQGRHCIQISHLRKLITAIFAAPDTGQSMWNMHRTTIGIAHATKSSTPQKKPSFSISTTSTAHLSHFSYEEAPL
jgi:hypothetical protein